MDRIVFNVNELADYLKVSQSTIRKLIREKAIPHFRIFSKILFNKQDIDLWIQENINKNYIKKT